MPFVYFRVCLFEPILNFNMALHTIGWCAGRHIAGVSQPCLTVLDLASNSPFVSANFKSSASTRQVNQKFCANPAMKITYAACVFQGMTLCREIELRHGVVRNRPVCRSASWPEFHSSVVQCLVLRSTHPSYLQISKAPHQPDKSTRSFARILP